jgi:hypothetical protein
MTSKVRVEIFGLSNTSCSPFPCDENRTCGFVNCERSGGQLTFAFEELKKEIEKDYRDQVDVTLTLLDKEKHPGIQKLIEKEHPPLPIILVNGKLTRIGRIAYDRIKKEIDSAL